MVPITGRFSNQRSQGAADREAAGAGDSAVIPAAGVDDELVMLIADRVYQRLVQDLRIERERLRLVAKDTFFHRGGR
jgi:hypothetical protein